MSVKKTYYSNGKLLLTGEYLVLDGAIALAIPTKYGQTLSISPSLKKGIHWISKDYQDTIWFETHIEKNTLTSSKQCTISNTLCNILQTAKKHNPNFLTNQEGILVTTTLDFKRDWGLGTSSTLINNIAQWATIDAFTLLEESFGGSGYDIAAAQHNSPILYTNKNKKAIARPCTLDWDFKDQLYFIHLNKKQDSKQGIASYRKKKTNSKLIELISDYSLKLLLCYTLQDFERLLNAHEQKIAALLELPTIKEQLFKEYPHTIKSLGAWGGDFILATGTKEDMRYFKQKGYTTCIAFKDMILL